MIKCPRCHTSIPNNSVYCRKCGEKIVGNRETTSRGLGGVTVPITPVPDSLKGLR